MNTIGIALIWCIVQITLLSLLTAGLYVLVRRLRPAAAAPVVFSSLAMVVILSGLALSPWPRWTLDRISPLLSREGPGVRADTSLRPSEEPDGRASSSPLVSGDRPGVSNLPADKSQQDVPFVESLDGQHIAQEGSPSSVLLLWRNLLAELSNSQSATPDVWRWPAVVAVVLLAAMICGLGWLVLGVAAVRWQRIRSRPVRDVELLELIDVLRAELGCLRPVEVCESNDLATAATIGWRRPVVLLPVDWRTWTPEQRWAVLAHEIVHARRHDFLALLFGQLGLMLHCYHPLLHWLVNRLRLEQELAADAAAASISGGPRQYLSTIAELALHTQERRLSWPTRTFLPTQTTFLRRIAMLRDSKPRSDRLSPMSRVAAITVVLMCGFLVAGLRGPTFQQQALAQYSANVPADEPADSVKGETGDNETAPSDSGTAPSDDQAASDLPETTPSDGRITSDAIVEGIGWKGVRIGITKEELVKALGKADDDSKADWLKWKSKHIECTFHTGATGVSEVRFNPGFKGTLANGLKLGSSGDKVLKLYGEPEHVISRDNGAKEYEYSKMGILFWTYQGKITQIVVFASTALPSDGRNPGNAKTSADQNAANAIVEGVGWKDVRIGAKREDLLKALGKPDNDSTSDWLKWKDKDIECSFHHGATGVSEIHFNPGFKGALANGLKVGSSGGKVLKLYGEPESVMDRGNGAKRYEYSKKGILFWTYQGKITQIVVFRPYRPQP